MENLHIINSFKDFKEQYSKLLTEYNWQYLEYVPTKMKKKVKAVFLIYETKKYIIVFDERITDLIKDLKTKWER